MRGLFRDQKFRLQGEKGSPMEPDTNIYNRLEALHSTVSVKSSKMFPIGVELLYHKRLFSHSVDICVREVSSETNSHAQEVLFNIESAVHD